MNHPNNICNIPTSTANLNNHYMSCGSEHSEMESFYADSTFEDTQVGPILIDKYIKYMKYINKNNLNFKKSVSLRPNFFLEYH